MIAPPTCLSLLRWPSPKATDRVTEMTGIHFFSQFWRLGVKNQGASMRRLLVRTLPGLQIATFSLAAHMAERKSSLAGISSYKGADPLMRGPPS